MSETEPQPTTCVECGKADPCPTPWQCAENVSARREARKPRQVVIVDVHVEHVPMVKTAACECGATHVTIEPAMVAAARRTGSYLPVPIPCPCGRLVVGCNLRVKPVGLVRGRG